MSVDYWFEPLESTTPRDRIIEIAVRTVAWFVYWTVIIPISLGFAYIWFRYLLPDLIGWTPMIPNPEVCPFF